MSKTKTVNGKDYRWDYKNKKWVQSHGASGGESLKRTASSVVGHVKSLFTKKDKKKNNLKTSSKTSVSDHKDTGHTKLVKGSDGKVRRVKVSDTTKDKTLKGSDTSKMKDVKKDDGGKAAWLKKTRNSPAAKSGAFTDDERRAQQQKHRKSQAARKASRTARQENKKVSKGKAPEKVEITKIKMNLK